MIDLKGIKNIIFDYGGVIINIDFSLTINAFVELGFINVEDCIFKSKGYDLLLKMEKGNISNEDFRNELRKISKIKLADNQIDFAWNALLLDMPIKRIKLLEKLKTNYKIFLLSNTNSIHYNKYLKNLQTDFGYSDFNKLFDKAWFSFQIKMVKPDSEIYKHVLSEASIQPNETLFIDDSKINIEGAKKLGIKTYYLNKEDILDVINEY